jgi:hypothetical protein
LMGEACPSFDWHVTWELSRSLAWRDLSTLTDKEGVIFLITVL